ncbi:MAG: hypothetical protein IK083_01540 [Abditibacteriota bacterium]|nr:hypothetical protein [Abditibacteriota bacterium]
MRKDKLVLILILFAVIDCAFLYRPLFCGKTPVPGDYLRQMRPWSDNGERLQWNVLMADGVLQFYNWRHFYADCVKKGEMPLYNPYELSGTPFVGTGQSAVYYPLHLLLVPLGPDRGLGILLLLHLYAAQVFTLLLLIKYGSGRMAAALGALAYSLSGFMVSWMELPTLVYSADWLPAVFYFAALAFDRRSAYYAAAGGACLGLSVLAGHLQIAMFVCGCSLFFVLWHLLAGVRKRELSGLLVTVSFILCFAFVSAFQLLPSSELYGESTRNVQRSAEGYARYVSNSLHGERLVTLFMPDLRINFITEADNIEYCAYLGILPLFLAFCGIAGTLRARKSERYVFLTLLALVLLVACGSPLNYPLYYLIPGFNSMGGPNRLLFAVIFFLSLFAAFGLDDLLRLKEGRKAVVLCSLGVMAALFALSVAAWLGKTGEFIDQSMASVVIWDSAGKPAVFLLSLVVFACLLFKDISSKRVVPAAAVVLAAADLLSFGMPQPAYTDTAFLQKEPRLATYIRSLDYTRCAFINSRWSLTVIPDALMPPDMCMLYGIREAGGYDSLYSDAYRQKLTAILEEDPSPPENGNIMFVKKYAPGLGDLCDIVVSAAPLESEELDLLEIVDGCRVYRITNSRAPKMRYLNNYTVAIKSGDRERAWLCGRWVKIQSPEAKPGEEVWRYSPRIVQPLWAALSLVILAAWLLFAEKYLKKCSSASPDVI